MFTIYRSKFPRGGFRCVVGEHASLRETEYTRSNYANAREAYESRSTSDDERKAILLIDPNAANKPGTWLRVDKGDGETTTVTRDEVFAACHVHKVCRTGAELRRLMAQHEAGKGSRVLATDFARYDFKPWLSTEKGS